MARKITWPKNEGNVPGDLRSPNMNVTSCEWCKLLSPERGGRGDQSPTLGSESWCSLCAEVSGGASMGFHDSNSPEHPSLRTSPQCTMENGALHRAEAAPCSSNDRTLWGSFLEYEQTPLHELGDRQTKTLTKVFQRPSSSGLFRGGKEISRASAFPSH